MTQKQLDKLLTLYENGCTDSDIEDFCENNKVNYKEAYLQISIWDAPECCKNCKHVNFYPNIPPCSCCSRARQTDYFEER